MLIAAREGSYKVELRNGNLTATKNITLAADQELTLDLSEYKPEDKEIGLVQFDIYPVGADLYINGTLVKYDDPIRLNYGRHHIQVDMTGYETYSGVLQVGEPSQTVNISLAEGPTNVVSEETDEDPAVANINTPVPSSATATPTTNTSSNEDDTDAKVNDIGTVSVDHAHTISISAPVGAKIYLNGSYKGTVPTTFDKEIGTHTITLSQSGYKTKSYTVEVANDKQNIVLSFPEMIKAGDEE